MKRSLFLSFFLASLSILLLAACAPKPEGATSGEAKDADAATASDPGESTGDGDESAPDYDMASLVAAADVKRGQTLYLQCRACHALNEGEPHKVGPNLHGFLGKPAAQAPGFAYSEALTAANINWDMNNLDQWLTSPSRLVPGTSMVFIGVSKPEDRASLIAYLQEATAAGN